MPAKGVAVGRLSRRVASLLTFGTVDQSGDDGLACGGFVAYPMGLSTMKPLYETLGFRTISRLEASGLRPCDLSVDGTMRPGFR
jgi:hypothetical protein